MRIKNRIEPINNNAYFSGLFKPILLGIKSANKTNIIVTAKKEQKKPREEALTTRSVRTKANNRRITTGIISRTIPMNTHAGGVARSCPPSTRAQKDFAI